MRILTSTLVVTLTCLGFGCASNSNRSDDPAKTALETTVVTGAYVGTVIAEHNCNDVKPEPERKECIRKVNEAHTALQESGSQRRTDAPEDFESYRKRKDAESPVAE